MKLSSRFSTQLASYTSRHVEGGTNSNFAVGLVMGKCVARSCHSRGTNCGSTYHTGAHALHNTFIAVSALESSMCGTHSCNRTLWKTWIPVSLGLCRKPDNSYSSASLPVTLPDPP